MSINFSETRLPDKLSLMAAGGPTFSTALVETSGGFEHRNINWAHARMRYNLAPAIRTEEDLEFILKFFRAHKGRAIGFRFKDWTDFKASNTFIATADGTSNTFVLCKRYEAAPYEDIRRIHKPVPNTVKIYLDGIAQTAEVNYESGLIKFAEPPAVASKITADFEFDVFVRFDTDDIIINNDLEMINNLVIPLIEIKL